MLDLLIVNGLINGTSEGGVAIAEGKIQAVGDVGTPAAKEVIDAKGCLVMPGVIDTQVHFREPGAEHKEDLATGSEAAAVGGTTTVFEMPNTSPATITEEALNDKLDRARGRMRCHFAFFVGAAPENASRLANLESLPGTPGIKIFMGSSTGSLLVDQEETLAEVLANGKHRCSVHAELESRLRLRRETLFDPDLGPLQHAYLRDPEAALQASTLFTKLAHKAGRPVHILHISTADEVNFLSGLKAEGWDITMEVTPQHLMFAVPDDGRGLGPLTQMNPPIRDENHRLRLQKGLTAGKFDVFGSDHAPHLLEEKALPYTGGHGGCPSGMPGVQTMLQACLSMVHRGWLTLPQLIAMACSRPAELFGIKGKGRLEAGFDADVVVIDHRRLEPFRRDLVRSKCGWSPFEGIDLAPSPSWVIVNGTVAARDGTAVGQPSGQMVQFDWK